jgi:hypothetical protein
MLLEDIPASDLCIGCNDNMADSNFLGGTAATTATTGAGVTIATTAASATYFIVLKLCNLGKTCSLL